MDVSLPIQHWFSLSEGQYFLHVTGSYCSIKMAPHFHCFNGRTAARDANCA